MTVRCASCGEELLGAVNRCWRCGTKIDSRHGEHEMPPVRRAPVTQVVDPEVVADGEPSEIPAVAAVPREAGAEISEHVYDATLSDDTLNEPRAADVQPRRRIGSPFAASHTPLATNARFTPAAAPDHSPRKPQYPGKAAAAGGAVAALVLGLLSLAASFFTVGALFLALVGLPMGVWGVSSSRRGQAIVGLLLCCVALAISGFGAAALLYELRYGISPWETPTGY